MRHLSRAHNSGVWGVYREISGEYGDNEFDAVIAAQWHHCDDIASEFESLRRIVKPGGKVVLVDHGPTAGTFDMASRDALLNWLLRTFVTWAGSRNVPTEEAYAYKKSVWLRNDVLDVFDTAKQIYPDARLWQYKGMAMIDAQAK
jgi:ubiquinone/menaquinone biosynthesis C-methylase UbiE